MSSSIIFSIGKWPFSLGKSVSIYILHCSLRVFCYCFNSICPATWDEATYVSTSISPPREMKLQLFQLHLPCHVRWSYSCLNSICPQRGMKLQLFQLHLPATWYETTAVSAPSGPHVGWSYSCFNSICPATWDKVTSALAPPAPPHGMKLQLFQLHLPRHVG